jgi:hypothetical protein
MKKFLFALPIVALAGGQALAAGTMIVNHSGLPIDELFASEPWGANMMEGLGEGSLEAGMSHEVAAVADGVYDLRISAPDEGILCYMSNVEIKNASVELTPDMGKNCK